MKETVFIIGALALSSVAAKAVDIRVIGGRAVDLQPIHDWEEGGKVGERPLKHWKAIELVEWQAQGPLGHPVATIKVENTEAKPVWLRNCPHSLIQDLGRLAALEQQANAVHQQAQLAAAWATTIENSRVTGGSLVVAGDPGYLNWLAARDHAMANASANADYLRRAAQKLSSDVAQMRAKLAEKRILAMDTGTTYGREPIWDTGLVGR